MRTVIALVVSLASSAALAQVPLVKGGGGFVSTDIDTSAELAAILGDETGSGALAFGPGMLTSSKTFSADGTGADCAIVGTAANALGHANGCVLVTGAAGKVIIPVAVYVDYTRVTASYTGGGNDVNVYYGTQACCATIVWSVALNATNSFTAGGSREVVVHGSPTTSSGGATGLIKGVSIILAGTAMTQPGTAAGTATVTTLYYMLTVP